MNLKVKIAGVEFKNPIITASGTFGNGKEYDKFYDISVLGGVCTKGITLERREGNPPVRVAETAMGMLNSVGLQNGGVDDFAKNSLPFLRSKNTVVIANAAGYTEEDYVSLVKILSSLDIDMIELNISCPNVKQGGMSFGVHPESVKRITKAVRNVCSKPLIVKLSPNVASISDNAKAAEEGGADALSLINTLSGLAIDYRTRKPVLANVTGGLSGPAIKPVALKMVRDAYKAVKIPIIGLGGIMTAEDVLEFMIAGALCVQVGTANIYDPMAAYNLVNDLTLLCKTCNIEDINEVVGTLKDGT